LIIGAGLDLTPVSTPPYNCQRYGPLHSAQRTARSTLTVITITGMSDHDRVEPPITIPGMRNMKATLLGST
jgi:hypothetical protein